MISRLVWLSLVFPSLVFAAPEADERPAPHFVVVTEGASFPLREQTANVTLAGVGAHVRLTQRYENGGTEPIEARYIFPASTRAAVFALRIKHGGRTVEAKIAAKEDAQKQYAAALSSGHTAALLQQHRPNVLEMAVANIAPRDSVIVEVEYVELVQPEDGKYEWVLPGVVGPRYQRANEAKPIPDVPYARKDVSVALDRWLVDLRVESGLPIFAIQSPSHRIDPRFEPGRLKAELRLEDRAVADRDLVIEYWLAGGAIETGMMVAPDADGDGGYFLLQVEPPRRVAAPEVMPREYVFVLDVSGSMSGFPLDTAKVLLEQLISTLRAEDRFNVVLFAGDSALFEEQSVPATARNLARFREFLEKTHGGGGTELLPALERAFALPHGLRQDSRVIAVITDGFVDAESSAFRLVREKAGGASVFAFGIGASVNRHLIEGLARAGRAEAFVVEDQAVAAGKASDFRDYIASPVLTGIGVTFDGFDAHDIEPAAVPDLFASRPLSMIGRYRGKPGGRVRVSGATPAGRWSRDLSPNATLDGPGLRLLWARERIGRLELEEPSAGAADAEIEALGLEHSLLTRRTSFIAVDKSRRVKGKGKQVHQPSRLPHRVEESAVGTQALAPASAMQSEPMMAEAEPFSLRAPEPASGFRPAETFLADPSVAEVPMMEAFAEAEVLVPVDPSLGGSYRIAKGRVLDPADRAQRSQARESLMSLLPIHTYLLPLRHTSPAEIKPHLEPFLSKNGRITVDARTNTLLVQDHREELERIRELARVFDVPVAARVPAVIASRVELTSGSGIAANDVISVADRYLLQVRLCYQKALRLRPTLVGTLVVGMDVDATGRVTAVALEEGTLPYAGGGLESCLLDELGALSFPAAPGATESHVTLELVFGAAGNER